VKFVIDSIIVIFLIRHFMMLMLIFIVIDRIIYGIFIHLLWVCQCRWELRWGLILEALRFFIFIWVCLCRLDDLCRWVFRGRRAFRQWWESLEEVGGLFIGR
jgi:hypothetical protein